jgi:hypothetical protein
LPIGCIIAVLLFVILFVRKSYEFVARRIGQLAERFTNPFRDAPRSRTLWTLSRTRITAAKSGDEIFSVASFTTCGSFKKKGSPVPSVTARMMLSAQA